MGKGFRVNIYHKDGHVDKGRYCEKLILTSDYLETEFFTTHASGEIKKIGMSILTEYIKQIEIIEKGSNE